MCESNNENKIKSNQKELLYLLNVFHNLCEKHNIKYTLDAGTLIGAVRHKGFIPWDDDCDVTLIRTEYEKLMAVLKNEKLPDGIGVYIPSEQEEFFDFNVRLYNKNVVIRDDKDSLNQYGGFYSHPLLDIFVMDYIPKKYFRRRMYVLYQQIIFGLAMSKRNTIKIEKYKLVEKIGISILSKIGKLFSIKELCDLHDKFSKMYFEKGEEYLYCTGWSPEFPGYVYKYSSYENVHKTKFEDSEFYIIDDYDEVLTIGYGDWKKPIKTHDHERFIKNL